MRTKKITVATWVTLIRVILVVPFVVFLMVGGKVGTILALATFVVASLSDALDGYLARSRGEVSNMGAFLDPLADKMLVNSAFVCLAVLEVVPVLVPVIFICRDFAVDGIRMMSAREGKTVSASILGKLKTASQMVVTVMLLLERAVLANIDLASFNLTVWMVVHTVEMVILVLAVTFCLLSGAEYVSKGCRELF